jgi:hypothetical protein
MRASRPLMLLARVRSIPTALLVAGLVTAVAAFVMGTVLPGLPGTSALFTNQDPVDADVVAGRIFPGERDTPAFSVTDASSGSATDASSPIAYAADGRSVTTSAWSTAFAPDRYLDFDLNSPLPAGLDPVAADFRFRWASATGGSTSCYFFEVRSRSNNDVLQVVGSAGSPAGCVTGTTPALTVSSISAVATTDIANDLRIRVYGSDAAGGASVVDAATVAGDDLLATFTLYPVRMVDAADTTPGVIGWGPAGQ